MIALKPPPPAMPLVRPRATERKIAEITATPEPVAYYHSGDLGDVIYSLAAVKAKGAGRYLLGRELGIGTQHGTREPMTESRADLILPLVRAQQYITSADYVATFPTGPLINLNEFRALLTRKVSELGAQHLRISLYRWHFDALGLKAPDDKSPWLQANPREIEGRPIVAARSPRYHRAIFPWKQIVRRYADRMVFVGHQTEWDDFVKAYGFVQYVPTSDFLELATIIAGARVFIGNQSSPLAVAEALKKPVVQETFPPAPNCVFNRPDLLAFASQECVVSDFINRYLL